MNTRLHDIIDGDLPAGKGSEEELFALPEERQEFQEHQQLRQAMRQNANVGGLTSAEKADMRAALSAAIGLTPLAPAPVAASPPAATIPTSVPMAAAAKGGWYGKGLAALLLGMILGAGLFMLLGDKDQKIIEKTVGVPVQTVTPAAVPFGMPEPAAGAMCDSLVDQLRDSIKLLQNQPKSKAKKKSKQPIWMPEEAPSPGDNGRSN